MKPLDDPPATGSFSLDPVRPRLPARLLCVEDNDRDFRLFQLHLEESALKPRPSLDRARSLREALQLFAAPGLARCPFDLIVLDLSLPDSSGPATYFNFREAAPDTAIVILSGTTDHELALEMVQHGAQDYLPKDSLSCDLLGRALLYALERQRVRTGLQKLNEQLQRTTRELKSTQMHLIQAEKLDSLGRLAAGVAHEVKNPLAVLQLGVDYLNLKSAALDANAAVILGHMQHAIARADAIIRDMLDFSRSDDLKMTPCDINQFVASSVRMMHHELIRRKIDLVEEFTPGLPQVRADGGKLEQVLINIIMNAAQAMPHGGPIRLRTFTMEFSDPTRDEGSRKLDRLRSGDTVVVIEARDHGTGISDDVMGRIFEPFFTTKPTGEGTGLGLAVARRIIDLHHGRLQVDNMTGPPGVRVRIILRPEPGAVPAPAAPACQFP